MKKLKFIEYDGNSQVGVCPKCGSVVVIGKYVCKDFIQAKFVMFFGQCACCEKVILYTLPKEEK